MSYPAFSQRQFPSELTQYHVPLFRPPRVEQTLMLFTVDWEKDHGEWRYDRDSADYGGIIRGTPALCDLLDELGIPCTWLVECHSSNREIDMPSACPEPFDQIARRRGDEIGLHVHWGDHERANRTPVDLRDRRWVESEIGTCTSELAARAGKPVRMFRSGGHFAVPRLPSILQDLGYLVDGSVEDRRGSRRRRLHSALGLTTDAYHPTLASIVQVGRAAILEVPTSLHLHQFEALRRAWRKLFPVRRQRVISIYIHIDELTEPGSAPNEAAKLDAGRLSGLRRLLEHWKAQPEMEWVTATKAARRVGLQTRETSLAAAVLTRWGS